MEKRKRMTPNVKTTLQEHSRAKVEFYTTYLKRYLRIINRVSFIKHINIYDVFCGMGIYEDGGKGSPVAAFEVVEELLQTDKELTDKITLFVNDIDKNKIEKLRQYINAKNGDNKVCKVEYFSLDVEDMFSLVAEKIKKSDSDTSNLVFIDPYGYKNIRKEIISSIMIKRFTEIILFLPIVQMYRFTNKAINSNKDETQYLPLKQFIESFFYEDHPMRHNEYGNILQYIEYIKQGLKIDSSYFTTSYYLERSKSHFFALFFITKSLYGKEKILEVKWELNEESGKGFNLQQPPSLFAEEFAKSEAESNYERLKAIIITALKKSALNNRQIYALTLENDFLPKHTNMILRQLQNNSSIMVVNLETQKPARKGSFYINWDHYQNYIPKISISLKQ